MPLFSTTQDPRLIPATVGSRSVTTKHALYTLFQEEWENLAHVREGTGGFMDGTFLVAHPREWVDHTADTPKTPTKKLKARRKLAHYENIAAAILEAKKSVLFRETPTRRVGDGTNEDQTPIEEWWGDVDGLGHGVNDLMPTWWDLAATFGHAVLYFEAPLVSLDLASAAQVPMPTVRAYTPLDLINWLSDDRGQIVAVKLAEAVPFTEFPETTAASHGRFRVREITTEGWRLFNEQGELLAEAEHGLGRLPITFLYGRRRSILSDLGQSILGRSQQYIDLYNLISELRELLRNQTFSFINIPLGTGADAMTTQAAKDMLGEQTGTMNVVFSGQAASILTGDAANVTSYQEEIQQRKRDIFRIAGVQWEADSRDAESGDSLRLKREDMNARIASYADECQEAEMDLADLFYRWQFGETGPDQLDEDEVTVQYPDQFDSTPFEELILQIQAANDIGMPEDFLKELRKNIMAKFEGMANMPAEKLAELQTAIEEDEPVDPIEQAREMMAMKASFVNGEEDDDDGDGESTSPDTRDTPRPNRR